MARKVPGIKQMPSGRWKATAYDPVTKSKVSVGTFDTQQEAIEEKETFERTKRKDRRGRRWTVDEFVAEWVDSEAYQVGRGPTTRRHNKERVQKLAEDFKGVLLNDIDRPTARKWAVENKGRISAIRAMFGDAYNDGLIERNPFANLRLDGSKGRKEAVMFTEKEMGRLIQMAYDTDEEWPVLGALITTAAYSGMRLAELMALQWRNIDWEKGTILVDKQWLIREQEYGLPKNGKARTILMLEPVAEALRGLQKIGPDGTVFYTKRGARYQQNIHTYYWQPLRSAFHATLTPERRAKISSHFDFHELRHFCGSLLADFGATAQDIAVQLGHTDGGRLAQELYIHTYEDNALARLRAVYTGRQRRVAEG